MAGEDDGDNFDRAAVRCEVARQGYRYGAICAMIAAATLVVALLAWSGATVAKLVFTLPISGFAWFFFHYARRWKNGDV